MNEGDEKRLRQMWAPWRMAYIDTAKAAPAGDPCFLCRGLRESDDRGNLVIWRRPHSVVVLNRFPYNNGHLLVAPRDHKAGLRDLSDAEHLELQQSIARLTQILDALMKPDGYNVGLNQGQAAGAGLPGHLHWHIVPRWHGDTNFMPILTDTRVIVQSLEAFYDALVERVRTQSV